MKMLYIYTPHTHHHHSRPQSVFGVVPDYTFADAPHIDLLVVPGGYGVRAMLESNTFMKFFTERSQAATYVLTYAEGIAAIIGFFPLSIHLDMQFLIHGDQDLVRVKLRGHVRVSRLTT